MSKALLALVINYYPFPYNLKLRQHSIHLDIVL